MGVARSLSARWVAACALVLSSQAALAQQDPLPSWNDTAPKRAIVAFVGRVTLPTSPGFVPPAERIATFDNDGTLWAEQPVYVQLLFVIDRVKALALAIPNGERSSRSPPCSKEISQVLGSLGERELMQMMAATHTGMTTEEFSATVSDWIATARHPTTGKLYTEMVYQPMLELLAYLRANGFKTYIVSGGGIEFMRPWTQRVYGIPPEQVIGSSGELKFELRDGTPVLLKLPEIDLVDDKEGKPVGIQRNIGRRPVMAFGNSDGDLQMLQWTAAGAGPRFALLVHHTDAEREWAYDRESHDREARHGVGRGRRQRLDARRHQGRLENCLRELTALPPAACRGVRAQGRALSLGADGLLDRVDQELALDRFSQVANGAERETAVACLRLVMRRDDDDRRRLGKEQQQLLQLDARHLRHLQVEHDTVGHALGQRLEKQQRRAEGLCAVVRHPQQP